MRSTMSWAWFRPVGEGLGRRARAGTAATWSAAATRAGRRRAAEDREGAAARADPTTGGWSASTAPRSRRQKIPCRTDAQLARGDHDQAAAPKPTSTPATGSSRSAPATSAPTRWARGSNYPVGLRLRLHVVPRGRVEGRQPALGLLGQDRQVTARPRRRSPGACCGSVALRRPDGLQRRRGPRRRLDAVERTALAVRAPRPWPPGAEAAACPGSPFDGGRADPTRPGRLQAGPHRQTVSVGPRRSSTAAGGRGLRASRPRSRVCPQALSSTSAGRRDALRLSMLRPVWFSPTLTQSDRGADWFRCDVVASPADQARPLPAGAYRVLERGPTRCPCRRGTAAPGAVVRAGLCSQALVAGRSSRPSDRGAAQTPARRGSEAGAVACKDPARAVAATR